MEAADSSPPAEVSRVAVRLPPFSAERPAVWFAQADGQLSLAGVNNEKTKSDASTFQRKLLSPSSGLE
jgi:hypothetical protein